MNKEQMELIDEELKQVREHLEKEIPFDTTEQMEITYRIIACSIWKVAGIAQDDCERGER